MLKKDGDAELRKTEDMSCRRGCGACCIAPSIASPLPGMARGKPAGMRCAQLSGDNLCVVFGRPERPGFCVSYRSTPEFCGQNRDEALRLLEQLEAATGSIRHREE
jgi:Fe-S-cluster containining protein